MEPYGATQIFGNIITEVIVPSPPPPTTTDSDASGLPSSSVKGLVGSGGVASPAPGTTSPSPGGAKAPSGPNKALVAAAAVLGVAALAGVVAGVVLFRRNKRKAKYIEKLEYKSNPTYGNEDDPVRRPQRGNALVEKCEKS